MDFEGNHQFAKYSSFKVAGEAEKYKLVLGGFVGGDAGEWSRGGAAWAAEPVGKPWGTRVASWLCLFPVMVGGAKLTTFRWRLSSHSVVPGALP